MSSDPEQIRAAARIVSGLAARARTAAVDVTGAGHARWESLGAQRFRAQLARHRTAFQHCAGALDELSALLLTHARHVEAHEAAIAQAAHAVARAARGIGDDARTAPHDVARVGDDVSRLWEDTGGTVLHGVRTPW